MKKAQVFISCGQRTKQEKAIGDELVKYFKNKKFDTYFAEHVHSSKPLLQSIFDALKESEYFVAYNPYRGKSKDIKKNEDTGSIFVQQEIATAAILGIPSLYFYDKGVKKTEGMSGALHLNGKEITNSKQLRKELDLQTSKWKNTSKKQLFLKFGNPSINIQAQQGKANWWHVSCKNGSASQHAKNCMAYIEKIKDLGKKITIKVPYKCEIVWAGVGMHNISIMSNFERDFDAIYTFIGFHIWQPQILQTSNIYTYPPLTDGLYKIVYLVVSDNFPDARLSVTVELKNDVAVLISQRQL